MKAEDLNNPFENENYGEILNSDFLLRGEVKMSIGKGVAYLASALVIATAIHTGSIAGYLCSGVFLFIIRTDVEGYIDG